MFERYTEAARRAIFFARYEASQFQSPYIETEHLLLGIVRESKALPRRLGLRIDYQTIHREIDAHYQQTEKVSVSVDLPLSNESKRVLAYAAEEAERLGHRHVGTGHLLVGLLREPESPGGILLIQHGADLKALRVKLGEESARFHDTTGVPHHATYHASGKNFHSGQGVPVIEIHGDRWNADYVRDQVQRCGEISWHWEKQNWRPRDIVVERNTGRISFETRLLEQSQKHDLLKAGWKKDYCSVCRWELFESKDDAQHGIGYTNGRDWLCCECYENFFALDDFFKSNYPEIT
jgi:hypothetical protein